MRSSPPTARRTDGPVTRWLARYSIPLLRVSLGAVFLGFGLLKFVPGLSPAEGLVQQTITTLTFGAVPQGAALLLTAVVETVIGLTLISGRYLRFGLALLAMAMLGIMSPLVVLFDRLFPAGAPTLEAQYVLKDIVLLAAATVVAAKANGARMTVDRHDRDDRDDRDGRDGQPRERDLVHVGR